MCKVFTIRSVDFTSSVMTVLCPVSSKLRPNAAVHHWAFED